MSIHQYNTQWWRLRSPAQLLRKVVWFFKDLPDGSVVLLSPIVPFLLLVNELVTLLDALLLTSIPILFHHLANLGNSEEFQSDEAEIQVANPEADHYRASIKREWQTGVRERLRANTERAEVYGAILQRMNEIPRVFGFTTGMGEQRGLSDISRLVHSAGLSADCALGHVLYAYAMGWTEAPVPGTEHGEFTRTKAIRVLRQFPAWPSGWDAQLSRVAESLRTPPVADRGREDTTIVQGIVIVTVFVPVMIWWWIEDFLRD